MEQAEQRGRHRHKHRRRDKRTADIAQGDGARPLRHDPAKRAAKGKAAQHRRDHGGPGQQGGAEKRGEHTARRDLVGQPHRRQGEDEGNEDREPDGHLLGDCRVSVLNKVKK